MREILVNGLSEMGLSPTGEQIEKLETYARLLLEQNQVMNLTAITQPDQVARLHFLDSAAILGVEQPSSEGTLIRPGQAGAPSPCEGEDSKPAVQSWLSHKTVIDVGTGAGFPGVVLKILEPDLNLTLVDSLGKRVHWLETVCEALSLDGVRCIHARAEELALEEGFRDSFDLAVSRAVAAYPLLCELCLPYVRPGGVFVAMKSVESGPEVREGAGAVKRLGGKLLEDWDYPVPGGEATHRLVPVRKVSPTPKGLPRKWGQIKKKPL